MASSLDLYNQCIENSEKVCWKVSDLLPNDYKISYEKRFLPRSLTFENELELLTEAEARSLNQILGASYFNIFAFVEEYITLFTLNLATDYSFSENHKLRAYVRFSEEEIKHQILFRKYLQKFNQSFKVKCEFIGGAKEVASSILSNSKLCVLMLTYHLELITQQHYADSVKEDEHLDEKFKEILRCHWLEESQHARLDLYKLKEEASQQSEEDIVESTGEYLNIIDGLQTLFRMQCEMNYRSLVLCSPDNKKLQSVDFEKKFIESQLKAYIKIFVTQGLENRNFQKELKAISPQSLDLIVQKNQSLLQQYEIIENKAA